jgi:tripartite-type tricarboxylate transporter receptor subunit TctC
MMAGMRRRRIVLAGGSALATATLRGHAAPVPLRLVVAYPPGGVSDEIARLLADRLAAERGSPVLVEHRPGGGGGIAMEMLSRAAPDGNLLVFSAGTPALAADSFQALVAQARAHAGAVRWATTGVGTTGYRVLEAISSRLGLEITHIPYKGGGQSIQDGLGGQFEVMSTNVAPAQLQHVALHRLTALAVGAPRRLQALPDTPTLAELGVPQANLMSRFGVFAPRGTSRALREALNAQVNRALKAPPIQARLREGHNAPGSDSVADFEAVICAEMTERATCRFGA